MLVIVTLNEREIRLLEEFGVYGKDKKIFRHIKYHQNSRSSLNYNNTPGLVALELNKECEAHGLPLTLGEFRRTYEDVCKKLKLAYTPTLRKVITCLPDYLKSHITILTNTEEKEPLFTRVLEGEELKKSLQVISSLDPAKIPKAVSVINRAVSDGTVDRALEKIEIASLRGRL